jgi:hypothetical protein
LIGGSGLINGLVECDTPHVIKGRIVKQNNISKEENLNRKGELMSTTLYETRSNKMIFNLLTPNGFMSLTDYTTDGGSDDDTDGNDYVDYAKTSASVVPPVTPDALFQMGRTVVTANANESLSDADIRNALALHQSGKWGNIGFNDYRENNNALKNGSRILSAYVSGGGEKFWVLTEADRSCTTILMPDEY